MMNNYKDLFGREIKVGDYITYAANDGRCGVLRVGQVVELTKAKEEDYFTKEKALKVRVKSACYRMVNYETRVYGWQRQKDVTLGFLERLIVVGNPPEEVVNVLKD